MLRAPPQAEHPWGALQRAVPVTPWSGRALLVCPLRACATQALQGRAAQPLPSLPGHVSPHPCPRGLCSSSPGLCRQQGVWRSSQHPVPVGLGGRVGDIGQPRLMSVPFGRVKKETGGTLD